jgi:hypothetical protein
MILLLALVSHHSLAAFGSKTPTQSDAGKEGKEERNNCSTVSYFNIVYLYSMLGTVDEL